MKRLFLLTLSLVMQARPVLAEDPKPAGTDLMQQMMQQEMRNEADPPGEAPVTSEETPAANEAASVEEEQQSAPAALAPAARQRALKATAVLRALEKNKARTETLEAPAGKSVRFGSLQIVSRYCRKRPADEAPETFAFLEISDVKNPKAPKKVFTGWMMASTPALSAMQHPLYDIWVIGCKN